ncbi:glycosyltransferase family 2 protein [Pectinatus haikarae]|uniref:glycosyltransferase family 2 protein n=1 Tax=Pectinatus haikarae TaxID=349096 RepID=UPI0018C53BEE|nr:glycosyltransferase family 2 protein [Pectinatus haikarae]
MKITACSIVKNEEKNLPRWLGCMKKIADEIIIVDTGSNDRTKNIAFAADAEVYDFSWQYDFSAAKNYALSKAAGDWILFLDADEYFPDETIDCLKKYLYAAGNNIEALLCQIKNIDDDGNVQSSFFNIRAFRNLSSIRYEGAVHEHLVNKSGKKIDAAFMDADVYILHTGYAGKMAKEKLKRNLFLLKKDIRENGLRTTHYIYFAECYAAMQDYDRAVLCCEKFLQSRNDAVGMRLYIYSRLIEIVLNYKKDKKKTFFLINKALVEFPGSSEILFYKADYAYSLKKYDEAEELFEEVLANMTKEGFNASTVEGKKLYIYNCLAFIAELKGDKITAIKHHKTIIDEGGLNEKNLLKIYKLIRHESVTEKVNILYSIYKDDSVKLQFILNTLYSYMPDQISLYYRQILLKKYNIRTERNLTKDFLLAANYDNASRESADELAKCYDFVISGASLPDNAGEKKRRLISFLPTAYLTAIEENMPDESIINHKVQEIRENIRIIKQNILI